MGRKPKFLCAREAAGGDGDRVAIVVITPCITNALGIIHQATNGVGGDANGFSDVGSGTDINGRAGSGGRIDHGDSL
jgi:hypothetical protein